MKKNVSQKGTWGKVGAPPKTVVYPKGKFTVGRVVELKSNAGVCELTIRKRIKDAVKSGELVVLDPVPQPKGAVGRPQFSFILKEFAGSVKVATPKVKTPKAAKTKTPKVKKVKTPKATVTPVADVVAVTPVVTEPAEVVETASVTTPVEVPATVVTPAPLP